VLEQNHHTQPTLSRGNVLPVSDSLSMCVYGHPEEVSQDHMSSFAPTENVRRHLLSTIQRISTTKVGMPAWSQGKQ